MTAAAGAPAEPGIQHSIDRLVIGGRRLFGWGWAAHRSRAVAAVHLRVEGDGWQRRITAACDLDRHDVLEAYPDLVNAATAGFVVTGYIPEKPVSRAVLEVELADGAKSEIDITEHAETRHAERTRKRLITWVAQAVWRRLKRGDIAGIVRRARAQSYTAPSLDDLGIVEELLPTLRPYPAVCLVFDHNMGGGANQYCRDIVAERVARGQAVVLCTYNLPMLEYRLHLHRPRRRAAGLSHLHLPRPRAHRREPARGRALREQPRVVRRAAAARRMARAHALRAPRRAPHGHRPRLLRRSARRSSC